MFPLGGGGRPLAFLGQHGAMFPGTLLWCKTPWSIATIYGNVGKESMASQHGENGFSPGLPLALLVVLACLPSWPEAGFPYKTAQITHNFSGWR